MTATDFNRERMQWLNAVSKDCAINPTSFKVAHAIADHLNRVTETAWPSHQRIALRACLSSKTIQRSVGQLEKRGWISVSRNRSSSNRYRMSWAKGTGRPKKNSADFEGDKFVPDPGQFRPPPADRNVHQTYLSNLPKTFSSRLGEGRGTRLRNDRGTFEQKIADRFGPEMWGLLGALHELDPGLVDDLCRLEKTGQLTPEHVEEARLHVKLKNATT